jgi:hypothetical protein
MPYRPPKKTKRPDWNTEPDDHQRERNRLGLVAQIREKATRYSETDNVCPGCDTQSGKPTLMAPCTAAAIA